MFFALRTTQFVLVVSTPVTIARERFKFGGACACADGSVFFAPLNAIQVPTLHPYMWTTTSHQVAEKEEEEEERKRGKKKRKERRDRRR